MIFYCVMERLQPRMANGGLGQIKKGLHMGINHFVAQSKSFSKEGDRVFVVTVSEVKSSYHTCCIPLQLGPQVVKLLNS